MSDFEQELKAGFLEEAAQLLSDAEQSFLSLEANPDDKPTLEKIFRIAHNIKGSSKAVGFEGLGAFTHEFESFLLKCKNGELKITPEVVSLLLKGNDHLNQYISSLKADTSATLDSSSLIGELQGFKPSESGPAETEESISPSEVQVLHDAITTTSEPAPAPPDTGSQDLIQAAEAFASKDPHPLDASDHSEDKPDSEATPQSEPLSEPHPEPLSEPQAAAAPTPAASSAPVVTAPSGGSSQHPPSQPAAKKQAAAAEESIRVSLTRVEKLLNFVGEMVILQTVLQEQSYSSNPELLRKTIHQMGKVTKEVQDLSMGLRMVPLKQTFQKMQRIVRDTSALLGKKANLILEGEETEVDKTVLEALSDPLVHLVRNAVDHGLESPEDRKKKGKEETGTITLRAYHQSGKLMIDVKDNGGGIPANRLREKAVEKGILKPNQTISDKEAIQLIFHPGFSTKAQVTEVSGRGVGMDVVKTNIEQMQGEVLVDTELNQGSTFKIVLPLTLAIIDGMVVRCDNERFIIPLSHVHESVKTSSKDLHHSAGLGEVLMLRGENLPVIRLSNALGKKKKAAPAGGTSATAAPTEQIAIVFKSQGKPFATLVDDIIGQHQVVIKKLGAEIAHIPGYGGSAILGDGRPALILELGEMVAKTSINRQVV